MADEKQIFKRVIARETMRLPRIKIKPELRQLVMNWANKRIFSILDKHIRSHILRHTCYILLKQGGEIQVQQLVYHMQKFGYSSADTPYKFVRYIDQINLRYDLPLSFHYNNRYIKLDVSKM